MRASNICASVLVCICAMAHAQEGPVIVGPPLVVPACADGVPPGYGLPCARPRKNRFFAKIALGYAARVALEESLHAGSAQLTLGAQNATFGGGARLDVDAGRTQRGLVFTTVTIGPDFDFKLHERVRLATGVSFGAINIQRATEPGVLSSFLFEAHLEPAFDVVQGDEGSAFYIAPRVALELYDTTGFAPAGFLAQLALGYRY